MWIGFQVAQLKNLKILKKSGDFVPFHSQSVLPHPYHRRWKRKGLPSQPPDPSPAPPSTAAGALLADPALVSRRRTLLHSRATAPPPHTSGTTGRPTARPHRQPAALWCHSAYRRCSSSLLVNADVGPTPAPPTGPPPRCLPMALHGSTPLPPHGPPPRCLSMAARHSTPRSRHGRRPSSPRSSRPSVPTGGCYLCGAPPPEAWSLL
jgi:hypothetical protein